MAFGQHSPLEKKGKQMKKMKKILNYKNVNEGGKNNLQKVYTVPAGINEICDYTFCKYNQLEKIILPNRMIKMSTCVFDYTKIQEVIIKNNCILKNQALNAWCDSEEFQKYIINHNFKKLIFEIKRLNLLRIGKIKENDIIFFDKKIKINNFEPEVNLNILTNSHKLQDFRQNFYFEEINLQNKKYAERTYCSLGKIIKRSQDIAIITKNEVVTIFNYIDENEDKILYKYNPFTNKSFILNNTKDLKGNIIEYNVYSKDFLSKSKVFILKSNKLMNLFDIKKEIKNTQMCISFGKANIRNNICGKYEDLEDILSRVDGTVFAFDIKLFKEGGNIIFDLTENNSENKNNNLYEYKDNNINKIKELPNRKYNIIIKDLYSEEE